MRRVRHKAYRERSLARTVEAAGASFGWTDVGADAAEAAEHAARRRAVMVYLPMLFLAPFMTSLAYYYAG